MGVSGPPLHDGVKIFVHSFCISNVIEILSAVCSLRGEGRVWYFVVVFVKG